MQETQETRVWSLGSIPWRRKCIPIPVFLPGESHYRGVWWATIPQVAKSCHDWATEHTCTHSYITGLFQKLNKSLSHTAGCGEHSGSVDIFEPEGRRNTWRRIKGWRESRGAAAMEDEGGQGCFLTAHPGPLLWTMLLVPLIWTAWLRRWRWAPRALHPCLLRTARRSARRPTWTLRSQLVPAPLWARAADRQGKHHQQSLFVCLFLK